MGLRWPRDREKLKEIQTLLAGKIRIVPLEEEPRHVAGVDAAFIYHRIVSVACVYKYPEMTPVEEGHSVRDVSFPYIPGYLSFREGPAIIDTLLALKTRPDCVIFDGQGIAHPKGLGIASCVGVILDIPTIGCAKSRLIGTFSEPGAGRGSWTPLKHKGRTIGAVLRTRDSVKPLFVSPGHRIDLEGAIEVVMACTGRYRLTEPVRRADILSKRLKSGLVSRTKGD